MAASPIFRVYVVLSLGTELILTDVFHATAHRNATDNLTGDSAGGGAGRHAQRLWVSTVMPGGF